MQNEPSVKVPYEYTEPLVTERLQLRRYRPDDLDIFYSWRSREDVVLYQDYPAQTREQSERSLARSIGRVRMEQQGDALVWAIDRRADERLIGDIILVYDNAEHAVAEIGWTLHPDFHGQGFATEAARAVLEVAFDAIGFHRVKANLDPRNTPSEALCRRLGMRLEAHHIEDFWSKGEWTDSYIFALLAREWRAGRAQ